MPDGATYTGQWLNGMRDGLGILYSPDKSKDKDQTQIPQQDFQSYYKNLSSTELYSQQEDMLNRVRETEKSEKR